MFKAVVKKDGRPKNLSQEDEEYLQTLDIKLTGDVQEDSFFNKLQAAVERNKVKDTFVISGWTDGGAEDRNNKEFDFLIVSLSLKAFLHIELKNSSNRGNIKKAMEQLEGGKQFFWSSIPFPQIENWKYIRVMYYGNEAKRARCNPCQNCEKFLLSQDVDLSSWWKEIEKLAEKNKEPYNHDQIITYFNILKYLIFQMFLQDDCITKGLIPFHTYLLGH